MTELLLLALSAAVVDNLVLTYFLGVCPFLGTSRRVDLASGMGAAVTFVLIVAGVSTYLLHRHVLAPFGLVFLEYVAFIFVIAGTVQFVEIYVRRHHERLHEAFGVFLPMITTNCAILGVCLFIQSKELDSLVEVMVYSASAGVGFALAIVLMASLRERLDLADVPGPFRGAPIALLTAAILALAFLGFAGIGRSG